MSRLATSCPPLVPVILAGGSGERLWPLSKADYPKQFVSLDDSGLSLFQHTILRAAALPDVATLIVVCNHLHRFIVSEQLRQLGNLEAVLIVEPYARNTAPALALAALHAQTLWSEATLLVLPADHRIEENQAFALAVAQALPAAEEGYFVTFGITPTRPETGYGYIKIGTPWRQGQGLAHIARFTEKPDAAVASRYLAQGDHVWNSGMFVMSACRLLDELMQYRPAIAEACRASYKARQWDQDFIRPDSVAMEACPAESIDYAIMENTSRGLVLPVTLGWCDLGSWSALAELVPADAEGNSISGRVLLADTQGCYFRSHGPLIAAIGLRDLVVVAADDAILIGPKARMQEIKPLLQEMRLTHPQDLALTGFAHRPWGSFYHIDRGDGYQVKKLHLKPSGKISLQSHRHRSEHWIVVEGIATVTHEGDIRTLRPNQSTYIPAGSVHRLENRECSDLIVIEVQTGSYLGEDDIHRFEDAYNREALCDAS